MGRSTLIVMGCLYTLGCGRGSRAHASTPDAATGTARPLAQEEEAAAAPAHVQAKVSCTPDPQFPGVFDVPEGSAAAEVELRKGLRELLVVSDSGHHGAAIARPIAGGPVR